MLIRNLKTYLDLELATEVKSQASISSIMSRGSYCGALATARATGGHIPRMILEKGNIAIELSSLSSKLSRKFILSYFWETKLVDTKLLFGYQEISDL